MRGFIVIANKNMSYSTGLLKDRVEILVRQRATSGERGRGSGEPVFEVATSVWGAVTWTKGARAMQEGALEAYDVVMIRMRWNDIVNRDCRLRSGGKTYQILQFQEDRQGNQIQIIAQEIRQ